MSVISKLEPGISRVGALTMYELQSAIVDISHKQYRDQELDEEGLVVELQTAEKILKDSLKYLLYEPPKSPEGRMAQMALHELKMLRGSIKNIEKDYLGGKEEKSDKKTEMAKRLKEKLEKSKAKKMEEKENVKDEVSADEKTISNSKTSKKRNKKKVKK